MDSKILLRFDDVCPTMDWGLFNWAIKKMKEKKMVALLGVIPDNQDSDLFIDEENLDFWEIMKNLQKEGFTLAMHGFQHKFDINKSGVVAYGNKSEFAGHSYDIQFTKIFCGKRILESHGIQTDIFFAPAHSYDDITLRALADNGFRYISDGKSSKPYLKNGILCCPCRKGNIPRKYHSGYQTAVVHVHELNREDRLIEKNRFLDLISNHSDEVISFDEYKKWTPGCYFIQKLTEKVYMLTELYIKRPLAKIVFYYKRK